MPRSTQSCSYRTLYLSTIANTLDCTWQMSKMCYCGLKSSRRICKHALITPLPSCKHFCKKKHMQEGVWLLYIFFHNHSCQGGTGKFIYKASILDSKQLLSNIIDHKARQVPYPTRIADSYVFCSNHSAILSINTIASYIAIWRQEQKSTLPCMNMQ